jgi:tetratricopeptide (TPR) repeat protein
MPDEQYLTCYLCNQKNRIPSAMPRTSGIRCGSCGALLIDMIPCPRCGTKNRIEIRLVEHQKLHCGKCQAVLTNYHLEDSLAKTSGAAHILCNALRIEGKLHQWRGDWEAAMYLFEQAMHYSADNPTMLVFLSVSIGLCHAYLGHAEKAIEYIEPLDVVEFDWTDFTIVYELAKIYGLTGDLERAITYFEKARALFGEHAAEHRFENLLDSLRHIRDTATSGPLALPTCILLYDALRDYETDNVPAGVRKLQRALELDPLNPALYHQLGIGLVRQQQFEQAASILERGLELDAGHEQAQFALGNAYFHLGSYERALKAYKKTLHLNPHNIDAYHHLGLVYEQQGELDLAKEYWEDVLKVNPQHEEALRSLEQYSK